MSKPTPFVLPQGLFLGISAKELMVRHDGDILLQQSFNRNLSSVEATGNVTIDMARITGEILAGGTLSLSGSYEGTRLKGRNVRIDAKTVTAQVIYATDNVTIRAETINVQFIVAPEVDISPEAAGQIVVLESPSARVPASFKGHRRMNQFPQVPPEVSAFLQKHAGPPSRAVRDPVAPENGSPAGEWGNEWDAGDEEINQWTIGVSTGDDWNHNPDYSDDELWGVGTDQGDERHMPWAPNTSEIAETGPPAQRRGPPKSSPKIAPPALPIDSSLEGLSAAPMLPPSTHVVPDVPDMPLDDADTEEVDDDDSLFVPVGFGDLADLDADHDSSSEGRIGVTADVTAALDAILEPFSNSKSLPRDLQQVSDCVQNGDLNGAYAPLERAWKAWIRAHVRRNRSANIKVTHGFNVLRSHCQ